MIRINLLPKEILEKRRFNSGIQLIVLAMVAMLAIVVVWFGVNIWRIAGKNALLQQTEQTASQLRNQAEAYKIFEEKEDALTQRKQIADEALAFRVDWGRLTNELSLVMPTDSWLWNLQADEDDGVALSGYTIDVPTDVPDVGYKSVAQTMIRLANLEQIDAVWLLSTYKETYREQPAIGFEITTGIVRPMAEAELDQDSSVPAPPTEPAE